MKFAKVLAAAVIAVSFCEGVSAETIDFNSAVEPGGNTFVAGSVSITGLGGQDILFEDGSPNGTRALLGLGSFSPGGGLAASQWTATFASPQNNVSIDLGDFAGDADIVYLTAFNASSVQIGTASLALASSFSGMVTLNLTVADITSVQFGTSAGEGGIYADNLVFSPVPLPAMLPIFAAAVGFVGFVAWRLRRHPGAA